MWLAGRFRLELLALVGLTADGQEQFVDPILQRMAGW
jgi:hypothetical protein